MNKELQKLLKQINDKKNEVKSLVNDGKLDKAKAAKEELKELQNRFDLLYDLDEEEQDDIKDKVNNGTAKQVGGDVKPDKNRLSTLSKPDSCTKRQTRQTSRCTRMHSHLTQPQEVRERSESV